MNVLTNTGLTAAAASNSNKMSPVLDVCDRVHAETVAGRHGEEDMTAVIHAIARHRSASGA